MIAKSLKSSSEFGSFIHSTTLALGNSFPMTGVMSNESYSSKAPESWQVVFVGSVGGGQLVATKLAD